MPARAMTVVLIAVVCGCGCGCAAARQEPLSAAEYRRQANALCAGRPGDMASLKPPRHLQALHDRAAALSDSGNRADPHQLASVYAKLGLSECVDLFTPDEG